MHRQRQMEGAPSREPLRQQACKPDSVVSSHPAERPTWTSAGNLRTVLIGLAPGGVCLAAASPRRRCALTAPFHPCLRARGRTSAVSFLWHFPAGSPGSALPTTSPCGVRTFLEGRERPPRLLSLRPERYSSVVPQ